MAQLLAKIMIVVFLSLVVLNAVCFAQSCFQCNDGPCISFADTCNVGWQCNDGSDEACCPDCPQSPCC
uniref:Uncharacterized protein n=1 Tax=Acrobeloides nanus TaxID=290746 RepID=A0A914E752_9BILA